MQKIGLIGISFFTLLSTSIFAQGLVNKSVLTVQSGANLYVKTSLTNAAGAVINNDGNVIVSNNGLVTNQGIFYVFDDASFVQTTNGSLLNNTGQFNVQRQGNPGSGWTYWSSPVASAPSPGSSPYSFNPGSSTQWYNDDNNPNPDPGWALNGANMTPGVGRATLNATGLASFVGTANNANVPVGLSYTAYAPLTANPTPFNFVGNPYPCALDAVQFVTDNASIFGAVYYWDHGGSIDPSDYAVWNLIGPVSPSSSGGSPGPYIGTGQGFFVRSLNAGTLNFNNDMRVAGNNTQFFRMDGDLSRMWFSVENDANADYNEILIGMLEDATDGEDRLYDAVKLRGNSNLAMAAVQTEIDSDWEYAIVGFPPPVFEKIIPLNVLVGGDGNFTFTARTIEGFAGYDLYFDDVQVPGYVYLQEGTEINVGLTEGLYQDRFYLGIVPEMIVTGDDEPGSAGSLGLSAFIGGDDVLHVRINGAERTNGVLELVDMRGRRVWYQERTTLTRSGIDIPVSGLSNGVYSVRFLTENKAMVQKVIKG